jgi:CBS domain-containing protein
VERIEAELKSAGLQTDPDFRTAWIDGEVTFKPVTETSTVPSSEHSTGQTATSAEASPPDGPDYVVGMLDSANRDVVSVNPQDGIEKAVTLMMMHDYSQLAVMTGPRELKGAISWKSIGRRLSQRAALKEVQDATDPAEAFPDNTSLFDATRIIIDRDFVFVRSKDKKITGIVTASDLSQQFHALSEPFLILGRIEAYLRRLIRDTFDTDTLRSVVDDSDPDRKSTLTSAAQLTFGEYQRLFERTENWDRFGFVACRKTFCSALEDVRRLRNEIMHFHPDSLEGRDHDPLRRLLKLLETLDGMKR